jgi:hypothetical protein
MPECIKGKMSDIQRCLRFRGKTVKIVNGCNIEKGEKIWACESSVKGITEF